MKKISTNYLNNLLVEYPANGIKVLQKPYVLVIKGAKGTTVVHQNRRGQGNKSVGASVFGESVSIDAIFDVEITTNRHVLALIVCFHDDDGSIIEKKHYIIGEKGPQDEYVTAFYAYEAEDGNAVYCISLIEEPENKPIFTAAVRFGQSSKKLLKTQLIMYLALSGLNGADREKIITGGGLLPPPLTPEMEEGCGSDD